MIDYEWQLNIPDWLPDSRLTLNGRARLHWQVYRKLRDLVKETIALYVRQNRPPGCFEYASVHIQYGFPNRRRRDPDNWAAAAKPILDTLVAEGVLVDDDMEHIELHITAAIGHGRSTRIVVIGRLRAQKPLL